MPAESDFEQPYVSGTADGVTGRALPAPTFRPCWRRCRLSISQAGYNTLIDLVQAQAPAVLVPFAAAGEQEQSLRAARMAASGAAVVVRKPSSRARGSTRA